MLFLVTVLGLWISRCEGSFQDWAMGSVKLGKLCESSFMSQAASIPCLMGDSHIPVNSSLIKRRVEQTEDRTVNPRSRIDYDHEFLECSFAGHRQSLM